MNSPNIFHYATKELSQDAVLCWLLEWAGKSVNETTGDFEKEELRSCGRRLLRSILQGKGVRIGKEVSVRVYHQVNGIDVIALVNARDVLLIEDKIDTSIRENELERYFELVRDGRLPSRVDIPKTPEKHIHCVYVKTGNIPLQEQLEVERFNYTVYGRSNLLKVLSPYQGCNDILCDYRDHLKDLEKRTKSPRRSTKIDTKGDRDRSWEGFLQEIEQYYKEHPRISWQPLSSLKGGYLGLWMVMKETSKNSAFEIWIEETRISFRLWGAKTDWSQKGMDREKNYWAQAFVDHGQGILKPPWHGLKATKSKPMCVSEWRNWIVTNNGRDLKGSVRNIDKAIRMMRKTIKYGRK